jgi:enoyl-CoA hydratase/carnithine racemase
LPLRIARGAYGMFALGELIEVATLAWGLVDALVPEGELRKRVHDAATGRARPDLEADV